MNGDCPIRYSKTVLLLMYLAYITCPTNELLIYLGFSIKVLKRPSMAGSRKRTKAGEFYFDLKFHTVGRRDSCVSCTGNDKEPISTRATYEIHSDNAPLRSMNC